MSPLPPRSDPGSLPWDAVQEALDLRRDPLLDPTLEAHLLAHPKDARRVLALWDRLGVLERSPAPAPAAPTPLAGPRMAAAAAGVLLALGLAWAAGLGRPPQPVPGGGSPPSTVDGPTASTIQSWRVTIEHRSPERSHHISHGETGLALESRLSPGAGGPPTRIVQHTPPRTDP